jgi:asparagine synthase (glutamine-hydrolysing)
VCGIAGALDLRAGLGSSERLVSAMTEVQSHRGPDGGGLLVDPPVVLGHRRLAILDLSEAGHQPMRSPDGAVWITYNGEIYNHRELRAELEAKGHVYRSRTDTETIIHLYEEEGIDCVKRLHGMFAFAIWDTRKQQLFLARDRLGVKPLYWSQPPGGFVFGSEIKALLEHPAITADLDEEAFFHYLTFIDTPAPMTMFKGIRKLGPGERMVVRKDGSMTTDVFWSPFSEAVERDMAAMSEPEMEERLVELLRASVDKRMMSDVPFGVFLSGGVDSSTNVALMSELTDQPVRTFSVAFEKYERYNELPYARRIAQQYGTDHHEVVIDSHDLESFLPELVHHQDEPLADWVCVPLRYVSKLARDNGTIVVMIGEGSDEIFHGYQKYIDAVRTRERVWEPLQRVPRPMLAAASRAATGASRMAGRGGWHAQLLDDAARGRQPFWGGAICWQGAQKDDVLTNGRAHPDSYEYVERMWREADRLHPGGADLYQKMTYMELKQRMAELLLTRVDKMTMSTSVEARVPFLDHELVEFAMALPPNMKVRDGVGKYILKRAAERWLPKDMVYRQKQGFGAPVAEWFRGDLGVRAQREIRQSALAERGLLDYDYLDRLWAAHRKGPANWSLHLWTVYNVSAWYDYWVAGRTLG